MALQSTPTLRWMVFGGMGASLLVGLLLAFWPMFSADRALQAVCRETAPGTLLADLQARALAEGYTATPEGAPPTGVLVDDPAGFGRRQCRLALDAQGRVTGPADTGR